MICDLIHVAILDPRYSDYEKSQQKQETKPFNQHTDKLYL